MNDPMVDLLAQSLEGNALGVKDAINDLLTARAMDALQAMKVDVAQSIYGNTNGDEDIPPEDPDEEILDDEAEIDDFADSNADDLFAELDQLVDSDDEEESEESEQDED